MIDDEPLANSTRTLLARINSVIQQASQVAPLIETRVVNRLSCGELPDKAVVDEIVSVIAAIDAIADDAINQGLAIDSQRNQPNLLERITQTIEEKLRRKANGEFRIILEHVLQIRHRSGDTPSFLNSIAAKAHQFLRELDEPPHSPRDVLQNRIRPFCDLWSFLTDPDSVPESEAEAAFERLEQQFGRGLVSAITLRRLVVGNEASLNSDLLRQHSDEGQSELHHVGSVVSENDPADCSIADSTSLKSFDGPHQTKLEDDVRLEEITSAVALSVSLNSRRYENTPRDTDVLISPKIEMGQLCDVVETVPLSDLSNAIAPTAPINHELRDRLCSLIWQLVGNGRLGLAYHIASCGESLTSPVVTVPSSLLQAAVLGSGIRSSSGEVVDRLRTSVENFLTLPQAWLEQEDELSRCVQLLVFGLCMRPCLLAPGTGASSLLDSIPILDSLSRPIGEIRQAVAKFGSLNLELSPTVLKGVCDHAVWDQQLAELRSAAKAWLNSNRLASIIYAATTDVWHRWLESEKPLGRVLEIVIGHQTDQKEHVREQIRSWSNHKFVDRELARTDEEIRKNGARRRPIEARARTGICSRVAEFVLLAQSWLDLLTSEPRTLDDYRQKSADSCRRDVQQSLEAAVSDLNEICSSIDQEAALFGAAQYARSTLDDVSQLFDASRHEDSKGIPARMLMSEELLALPDIVLDEDLQPVSPRPDLLLPKLELAATERYSAESAFRRQSDAKNHLATQWVIDAAATRPCSSSLAEQLRLEREDAVHFCRELLRRKLDESRQIVEQAVCYDLITDEERNRFLGTVEEGRLLLDEVADFATEIRKVDAITLAIDEKKQHRLCEVRQKLTETEDTISSNRLSDLEIVRQALDRGDFLSADEYIELIRNGQPLVRTNEDAELIFSEFFPNFVQELNSFMDGRRSSDGRRPEMRSVIEQIREGRKIGPVRMDSVGAPQAKEAAAMVAAWIQLKNHSGNVSGNLTTLLSGFGFREVRVQLPKSSAESDPNYWVAHCQCVPLGDPAVCIVPYFGSQAKGRYRILGVFDRPGEEAIVDRIRESGAGEPTIVLYFGRMTEQRRRNLAELCWYRRRSFLAIDEALVFFLCRERSGRLPTLFQCALPFTVSEPYTTTASLVPVEMFFGREQERRAVVDRYGTNLVYGGRQLGKSALLRDVERREHDPSAGQIVRWIDLKNRGIGIDRPTEDLWAVLGNELHEEKVLSHPATIHQTVVNKIKEWLKGSEERRILLLLDEADAFLEADSHAVSEHTRHSFPEVARLKGLMDDTGRRFKVVFAGLHNVQRAARDPNTPVAHLGNPVCIGPLLDNGEWRKARDLIEIPLKHMGFDLQPPELWMRILSYTNYYPSLVQVFCKHLLEYLHNRDRTTVDFCTSPPFPITAQHIEEVYQSQNLQDEIKHKFELTLGLDERYRLIALCIALASIEQRATNALVDGFDVAWVRVQALYWWSTGFSADTSYELFRTILDEMIGLGILRRSGADRYSLRSPNVLNLLGSKSHIEQKLIDVSQLPASPSYEASSFRRSLDPDGWKRSPLTAEQEASLIDRSNGVTILFGSALSGLGQLREALEIIPSQEGVKHAETPMQASQFIEWLNEVARTRSESDGVTLAAVFPTTQWSMSWVTSAIEIVGRKRSSKKRFLRVIFVADPQLAWDWCAEEPSQHLGVTELSLKPWREAALRRWMEDAQFGPDAVSGDNQILEETGGWGLLVNDLGAACRGYPHTWREQLDKIRRGWPNAPQWSGCCELKPGSRLVFEVMAQWDGPIATEELATLAVDSNVPRVLRWAERMNYVREVSPGHWVLDPIVRTVVAARE